MTWTILYSIEDAKGQTSTTEINVPAATAFADVQAFAEAVAPLINAVITGAIRRIGITRSITLPGGLRSAAGATSDVEEGARFQFRTANGFYSALRLPTFDETNVSSGSRAVITEDSDVAAFVNAMVTGIDLPAGAPVVAPCDKRGEDLISLTSALEQFLSSRG